MKPPLPSSSPPRQVCQVFASDDVFVTLGVNLNEGLARLADACLGDIYMLASDAEAKKLILQRSGDGQTVAAGSAVGVAGALVTIIGRYMLLAPDGDKVDLLAVQIGEQQDHFILPLSPMGANIEYSLVKSEVPQADERLIDVLCVSFARGTMITLGDGSQRPIETLAIGDRVLTRDHGPQPLRWLGHVTLRAVGAYAPVIILEGVMGNAADLVVSQHHRMFLYQRHKTRSFPKSEILVQAKHLVNGEQIFLREGGFVEFYSLVFDAHEIIYAEGIPAESLMVTEATVSRLPPDLAAEVKRRFPGVSQIQHFGLEAGPQDLAALRLNTGKRGGGGR
ncbi:Hint domain-containing protein [Pseudorhodobacter sp.]|uniref:Hint domain-containing protein n=1 Tax=Pseudorhodobacter sp. TaxID=1934400 RepID=UPI002B00373D|nr:Hint domain-containing protein [Pseudorhodobacter sp.]